MASIGIINDQGEQIERDVFSRDATIQADEVGEISPSVTRRVKFDNKGQMSSITSECGETENRREADKRPKLTVEGVIIEDEIDDMKALKNLDQITFVSDIHKGDVIIERLSIIQSENLIYYQPTGGDKELAFEFQMQLKVPE